MREALRAVVLLAAMLAFASCDFSTALIDDGDGGVPGADVVGFTSKDSVEDETSGAVAIDVEMGAPSDTPVVLTYKFAGSAQNGSDYNAEDGTLVFSPGETKQAIVITILPDTLEETDETIEITLSPPGGGARLGIAKHTLTISHNTLPRVNFTIATSQDMESVGTKTIELKLSQPTALPATVSYTLAGTASAGADYAMPAGTVTFAAGDLSATISLPVMDDPTDEDSETVELQLTGSANVVLGTVDRFTETIDDNDNPPSVSIDATSTVQEGNNLILLLNAVDVEVRLSVASGKTISIPVANGMGTAQNNDFQYQTSSPLTFNPGDTSKKIRIVIIGDQTDEDDQTIVTSIVAAMLDTTKVTAGATLTNTTTIVDDDPTPQVRFTGNDIMANEGDGNGATTYDYPLGLTNASEKVITFSVTLDGSATQGTDYSAAPLAFTFAPGITQGKVTVGVNRDNFREQDESIDLTISAAGLTNAVLGAPASRQHTIRNDD